MDEDDTNRSFTMRWRTNRSDEATGIRLPALVAAILVTTVFPPHSRGQEGAVQRVHDPHIIREGNSYYIFSTGPGIPIRRSKDLFHWEVIGRVFAEVPQWAREAVPGVRSLWAPDISYFNGEFRLYYSVSTFGSNRSCIGLATNKTLDPTNKDYRWVDQGKVLESRPGRDDWNAIDANFVLDPENRPWLAFGSFWSGVKLLALDPRSGKLLDSPPNVLAIASRPGSKAIEAAFIVRKRGFYYLFVSFDLCGRGVESTYKIMVGRSRDLKGPYRGRSGVLNDVQTGQLSGQFHDLIPTTLAVLNVVVPAGRNPRPPAQGTRKSPGHCTNRVRVAPEVYGVDHAFFRCGRVSDESPQSRWDRLGGPNSIADTADDVNVGIFVVQALDERVQPCLHDTGSADSPQHLQQPFRIKSGWIGRGGGDGDRLRLDHGPIDGLRMYVGAKQGRFDGLAQTVVLGMALCQSNGGDPHGSAVGERTLGE